MAKRIGKCTNIDCENYNQEFEIDAGQEFVCPNPKCGQPLKEVSGKKGGKKKKDGTSANPNWKLLGIIGGLVLLLAGAGFGVWQFVLNAPKIEKIKLDKESITLVIGEKSKELLKATVTDKKGNEIKNAKVTYKWLTDDESIATVTQGGEVTAVNKGETSITVKIEGNEGLRGTCQVVVNGKEIRDEGGEEPSPEQPVYIEQLKLKDAKDFTLNVGGTKQLSFVAEPDKYDESPNWTSSDPDVATVDANGLVTARKAGTATISIVAKNVTASVKVTVSGNTPTTTCTLNLGYGVYDGPCKGGKANGTGGTIRFTKHYTIDLKKASGETVDVESGDTMVNVKMDSNRLIQGQLKRKDGSTRWIIIG